jgi:hypothetical protein
MAILSLLFGGSDSSACSDLRSGANNSRKQHGGWCAAQKRGRCRENDCCLEHGLTGREVKVLTKRAGKPRRYREHYLQTADVDPPSRFMPHSAGVNTRWHPTNGEVSFMIISIDTRQSDDSTQ